MNKINIICKILTKIIYLLENKIKSKISNILKVNLKTHQIKFNNFQELVI